MLVYHNQTENHAVIGMHNVALLDTIDTANSTPGKPGWPIGETANSLTYGAWEPLTVGQTGAVILWDFGENRQMNYLLIAHHDLGSTGSAITLAVSDDNVAFTEVFGTHTPADDSPIFIAFPLEDRRYARIVVHYSGLSPDPGPSISVIKLGLRLEMPYSIYGGHSPVTLSRRTNARPVVSETGLFLGRSIIRKGLASQYNFKYLPAHWYRTHFDPFVAAARSEAFAIAWKPGDYPHELAYGWLPDPDIVPSNMGIADLMEVTFSFEAQEWRGDHG